MVFHAISFLRATCPRRTLRRAWLMSFQLRNILQAAAFGPLWLSLLGIKPYMNILTMKSTVSENEKNNEEKRENYPRSQKYSGKVRCEQNKQTAPGKAKTVRSKSAHLPRTRQGLTCTPQQLHHATEYTGQWITQGSASF